MPTQTRNLQSIILVTFILLTASGGAPTICYMLKTAHVDALVKVQ